MEDFETMDDLLGRGGADKLGKGKNSKSSISKSGRRASKKKKSPADKIDEGLESFLAQSSDEEPSGVNNPIPQQSTALDDDLSDLSDLEGGSTTQNGGRKVPPEEQSLGGSMFALEDHSGGRPPPSSGGGGSGRPPLKKLPPRGKHKGLKLLVGDDPAPAPAGAGGDSAEEGAAGGGDISLGMISGGGKKDRQRGRPKLSAAAAPDPQSPTGNGTMKPPRSPAPLALGKLSGGIASPRSQSPPAARQYTKK